MLSAMRTIKWGRAGAVPLQMLLLEEIRSLCQNKSTHCFLQVNLAMKKVTSAAHNSTLSAVGNVSQVVHSWWPVHRPTTL